MAGSSFSGIAVKLGVPVALVLAGLWAVDRYINSEAAKKIGSFLLIFVFALIVVALLIWILRKVYGALSAARQRREAVRAAVPPAETVSPQEKAELASLQESLEKALKLIRESKLARGRRPAEALYAMPWILLLGPAEAGKTTALEESGVDFLYTTGGSRRRQNRSGNGCEYWFSQEAVVLDLSGRIALEEEHRELIKGFFDQLKRARKDRPIDAVMVTLSVREVQDQSAEELEALADRLRQRFDEMVSRLGIRFPVYLLFTKCDQIEGFLDFFGPFGSRFRADVWGATISREQRRRLPVSEIFSSEFDRLAASLPGYRLRAMASEEDPSKLARIYAFPSRFESLRPKLESFVSALTQPTAYSERPVFRGFYFISAAGTHPNGEPHAGPDYRWDSQPQAAALDRQPPPTTSYFLENLFPQVIFADRPLVTPSVDTRLRRRLWLDVTFFATLVISLVLLIGMTCSFLGNLALIDSIRLAALPLTDPAWNGKRTADLMAIQQLRSRVAELDRYHTNGPRWTLRWGLYIGNDLSEASRHVYFRRLREAFIAPSAAILRQKLYAFSTGAENASSYNEFYSYLKTYLMMSDPARSDPSFLNNILGNLWKQLVPQDAEGVALEQLRFYAQQLPKNEPDFQVTPDATVVALARRALGQYPVVERLYMRLKEQGNQKFQPYTLAQASGGKSLDYLNSSHDVPGIFTEAGWTGYFKNALGQASQEAAQDDWVLGPNAGRFSSAAATSADYEHLLRDKYFSEYIDEWQKFLEGISVRPLADLTDARTALDSLSQQDSALSRVLMSVASNTMLRKDPNSGTSIAGIFSNALATLGLSTKVNRAELVDPVADQFQPLHDLVTSPDGKSPSMLAQYIAALGKVQVRLESLFGSGTQWDQVKAYVDTIANNLSSNEFQEVYRLTALASHQCITKSTRPIAPFLEQPLRQTWAAVLKDAGYRLDGLWRTQISDGFKRDLESSFPFNPSGRDVSLTTLSAYLKPHEGTLDAFYEKELKMFLAPAGDDYSPRTLIGAQVPFSASFLEFLGKINTIRQGLFLPGSPDLSLAFDLTPDSTPGVTESLLEIDGQRVQYRNETPVPYSMTWPSKSGASQAKLSISLEGNGDRPGIQNIEGEWALFHLLTQARVTAESQTIYTVTWSLPGSDGRNRDVRYKLQARSFKNPFASNFFRGVVCPERVTEPPAPSAATSSASY